MGDCILNQLKMAKILIAMEFDTQEEMDEYRNIHEVRPTTRMTVKKYDYGPQHYDDPEKFADRVHSAHNTFWHGTPSGDLKGGTQGLHVGTKQAARDALNATIGFRADGKDWDGTEEYGDVLLAGQDRIKEIDKWGITGSNCDFPKENFKLKDRPDIAKKIKHSNGDVIPLNRRPTIVPVRVNGKMWHKNLTDESANLTMRKKLQKGEAKHGYYYKNEGEDSGSISAVVPDERHISMVPSKERLKKIWHEHHGIPNQMRQASLLILSALEEYDDWVDDGPAHGEREKRNWRSKSTGEVRIQIIKPTTPSVKESVDGPTKPQNDDRGGSPHTTLDNDEAYLKAVKSGDLGVAQKMVDETAKVMGYTTKAAHSTNSPVFHSFNTSGLAAHFGTMEAATDRADKLRDFSERVVGRKHNEARVMSVALKIRNPIYMPDLASLTQTERGDFVNIEEARNEWLEGLDEDQRDEYENGGEVEGEPRVAAWESETDFSEWLLRNDMITSDEFWDVQYDSEKAVQLLIEKGYDGIVYENAVEAPGSESYIVFSPSQVKSVDPVVKDDAGDVIPLNKRFNSSSSDIRY